MKERFWKMLDSVWGDTIVIVVLLPATILGVAFLVMKALHQ